MFMILFAVRNFFTRIIKNKQILSSLIGKFFNQVNIYSYDKIKVFSLHLTLKRLIMSVKGENFVKGWLKNTNYDPAKNKTRFS